MSMQEDIYTYAVVEHHSPKNIYTHERESISMQLTSLILVYKEDFQSIKKRINYYNTTA